MGKFKFHGLVKQQYRGQGKTAVVTPEISAKDQHAAEKKFEQDFPFHKAVKVEEIPGVAAPHTTQSSESSNGKDEGKDKGK